MLSYVVTVAVDCCGVRCNEPCCLTCFGEERPRGGRPRRRSMEGIHEVLRQWTEEQS